MYCKYCYKNKKLIKAHILPRKFYLDYEKEGYQALNIDGSYKIFQSGFYDNQILCADCDGKILKLYDDEAYRLLLDIESKKCKTFIDDLPVYHYTEKEFNYDKIRKFFIALLWKASISNSEYSKNIDLGPYEKLALDILKDKEKHNNLFKIVVFKEKECNHYTSVHFFQKLKSGRQNIIYAICFYKYFVLVFPKYLYQNNTETKLFEELMITSNDFIIAETNGFYDKKISYLSKFSDGIRKKISNKQLK